MAAGDLTTLSAAKAFLDLGTNVRDTVLASAITRASRAITVHCQREFTPTDNQARVFAWDGAPALDLVPYDLRAASQVVVGTDDPPSQTVLAATDYRLRPKPNPDGVYQTIWVSSIAFAGCEVTITGDWGFQQVPADVEHWAIVTVATWLRQSYAPFVEDTQESLIPEPHNLPWAAKAGLRHYRRIQGS